ncbi:hypothetical protein GE061_001610 [Apolygus lucorum]|uniref:Uncharacterized protein n=1 Tax=Apolygus lucorum TaxID=248454 RepID=A0A6A4KI77_APOLU|nr:hypothetical protein GE061_001610 [Apolygus lucorum]
MAANVGHSAEQNTAALIASSMNSEYEDDWSTPASSYRDSHTPLTNSSISSNSADQKLGFGENLVNLRLIPNGSSLTTTEAEEAVFRSFSGESLPLLTFNEYEEIRNYTDLDLLEATTPSLLNEVEAISQPEPVITPANQEFKSSPVTPVKVRQKKTPSKKKIRQVPDVAKQLKTGSTQCALEINAEGDFMGFNEDSLRAPTPGKKKKKKPVCNKTQIPSPNTLGPSSVAAQPALNDASKLLNKVCDLTTPNHSYPESSQTSDPATFSRSYPESSQTFFTSQTPQMSNEGTNVVKAQEVTSTVNDVWMTESPKKDGNILKKKFVKKSIPQNPPNCDLSNSPVKKPTVLKAEKETPATTAESKGTPKAPSYLTLFPMRCKEYPMIYSCNHCVGIFTTIRAGQLHDCVKKRRGRKAGTKLQQSYSRNICDWALV